ncbi:MAG: glutaredoxin 3 [Halieaceae bacterium]|jgi:glutaredoxin 3
MKNITMYSKASCGYCHAAKELLNSHGMDFVEIDVAWDAEMHSEMMTRSQRRTVPQIFFDDEHIGGYTELRSLLSDQSRKSF